MSYWLSKSMDHLSAMNLSGAAAKLFWDSLKVPYLGFALVAVVLGLVSYSWVHYRKGRRELADKAEWIDDMAHKQRIWDLFKNAPPPLGP